MKSSVSTRQLMLAATVTLSLMLSGCVIAIHDGERESYSATQEAQSLAFSVSDLIIGSSINEVVDQLGGAVDSEGFERNGKTYIVLYYVFNTSRNSATTPLVFVDGKLVGWGHQVLESARAD
ncbi:MAG: DUF3192 domain-containing protein [Gammaproteobacteria bacterium]|nr:DUF3192 domain-containing protein [Gammaproteobacteria bacterium]NVK89348.1 DUF3192 domain-containing protein [Gammaproteobacteria bacterium]